jgi:Permuted papain-like amidase enzyme, YaeF/YiiX, C92 family
MTHARDESNAGTGEPKEPSTPIFKTSAVAAGDVVFVYDQHTNPIKRFKRLGNVIGQRLLASIRRQDRQPLKSGVRNYSHVMLGVGNGLIIHADGKKVAVEPMSDALNYETDERSLFQVFRRDEMSPEAAKAIAKEATRYYAQKYRFSSFFTELLEEDTTQFCSRLVAYAFRAADIPLTGLPDNKVLPLDLFRVCQSGGWKDVTKDFISDAPATIGDDIVPKVRLEGEDLSLSQFLAKADSLLATSARLSAQTMQVVHEANKSILANEALLAKFCGAQFDLAKALRLNPSTLSDKDGTTIARVLEQMQTLLDLSELPDIELLVGDTRLNSDPEDKDSKLNIAYPTPLAIREMQKSRETIRIYSYLLFAEIGLCVILAHYTPHSAFEAYRSVKREYADQFLRALQPVASLAPYENADDLFRWIDGDADRSMARKIFRNIVAALKVIDILRAIK